jgi:hypothetical protein
MTLSFSDATTLVVVGGVTPTLADTVQAHLGGTALLDSTRLMTFKRRHSVAGSSMSLVVAIRQTIPS